MKDQGGAQLHFLDHGPQGSRLHMSWSSGQPHVVSNKYFLYYYYTKVITIDRPKTNSDNLIKNIYFTKEKMKEKV